MSRMLCVDRVVLGQWGPNLPESNQTQELKCCTSASLAELSAMLELGSSHPQQVRASIDLRRDEKVVKKCRHCNCRVVRN